MIPRRTIALAAVVILLALAGCGTTDGPTPTQTATETPTATPTPDSGPEATVEIVSATATPGEISVTVQTSLDGGSECISETVTVDVEGMAADASIPVDACPDSDIQGAASIQVQPASEPRSVTVSAALSNGATATKDLTVPADIETATATGTTPAPTPTETEAPTETTTQTPTPTPTPPSDPDFEVQSNSWVEGNTWHLEATVTNPTDYPYEVDIYATVNAPDETSLGRGGGGWMNPGTSETASWTYEPEEDVTGEYEIRVEAVPRADECPECVED